MHRLLALILIVVTLSGCVTEIWGEALPGAYSRPGPARDIYRVGVVGCDGAVFTVIAVEVPSSRHTRGGGWYVIPIDADLRPFCP